MSGEAVVEAEGVYKSFGPTVALSGVSVRLGRGLHLLLGPNGSGKTTLLKLWAGLLRPSKGSVRTYGLDPWASRVKLLRRVSIALEDFALPWWMTGVEFSRMVSRVKGLPWGEARELASILGVDSYWQKRIRGYSSGMRKRLVLMMALLGGELILLDEPYTLIDKATVERLNKLIAESVKAGSTVVIATHFFSGIEDMADTATILVNGKLVSHADRNQLVSMEGATCICQLDKREDASTLIGDPEVSKLVESVCIEGETARFKLKGDPGDQVLSKLPCTNIRCGLGASIRDYYEKKVIGVSSYAG